MILLQINQVSKYFGAEKILDQIKFEIQTHDRIALVGRNGAGKSTLLKMIVGELSVDEGQIIKAKETSICYLPQNPNMNSEQSIWKEMTSIFSEIEKIESRIRELEQQMASESVYTDQQKYQQIIKEYDHLQEQFKAANGFQIENDIRSVLHGLGFFEDDYHRPVQSLSGGQKTRLALGKLLLQKPDILILDEPTNHLDITTLNWLENYLTSYSGAILVVSHDRYFLDKIVNQVIEISRQKAKKYIGNFTRYLALKTANYQQELKVFEKQQDEIVKLQDFIQRNIARASTTKRAQSRRKQLEKIERLDSPKADEKSANFHFEINKQSGNEVLQAKNICIGYDDKTIAKDINFRITRQESIALLGSNGAGKTTLLKSIINQLPTIAGEFKKGSNLSIGFYDQEQANLQSNKTVLQELWDVYPMVLEKDIRTLLGHFLFSGDDVQKPVSLLSGGEKARLALAKLHMQKDNFLILDEPTNHLDLDSKLVLENALIDYPGTILFVSHDRYFINRIADKVIELTKDGCMEYLGDYDYYLEKKAEQQERTLLNQLELETNNQIVSKNKQNYEMNKSEQRLQRQKQRQLIDLENQISDLETKITMLKNLQLDPKVYRDYQKSLAVQKEIEEAEHELEALYSTWTSLQEE